jgi:hypothetical protein
LSALVAAMRAEAPGGEIFAALGLGRSYGMRSRVLARTLPAILDCGLWAALDAHPPAPSRALVTDVGNDILYGAEPARILGWVAETVGRLQQTTPDVVIAGLPLGPLRRLSRPRFLAFRTLFYPPARIDLPGATRAAAEVERGLERIADGAGARFVPMRDEWYGIDPVHIRPSRWRAAWTEIAGLGGTALRPLSLLESARVLARPAERRWLFGRERRRPQAGAPAPGGIRLWLY